MIIYFFCIYIILEIEDRCVIYFSFRTFFLPLFVESSLKGAYRDPEPLGHFHPGFALNSLVGLQDLRDR
jgi:hypothetical protein